MKTITLTPLMSTFVLVAIISGCNTQAEKTVDSESNILALQTTIADARQDQANTDTTAFQKFKDESNEIINTNIGRIAELKINIKDEKSEAKENYSRDVNALEIKNRELKMRLADYTDDGKSAWRKFKRTFNHDLDSLGEDFKDLTINN